MGIDLSRMTESDRTQELDVVRNERASAGEIMPYRAARHRLWIELFPAGHPYHEEVIGSMQDLQAISLDDVRKYFQTLLRPQQRHAGGGGRFQRRRRPQHHPGLLRGAARQLAAAGATARRAH
jgi:predicted Zn-dependent peptidase